MFTHFNKYKYSIYFALPFIGIPSILTLVDFNIENPFRATVIYWVLFLVFSLFIIFEQTFERVKLNNFQISFLVFFFLYFLRLIADSFLFPVELGFPVIKYYAYFFCVILIPTFSFNFRLTEIELKYTFIIIFFISFIIIVFTLFENHYNYVNGFNRLFGGYNLHPIQLGHLVVTNFIITFYLFKRYRKSKIISIGLIFSTILALIVLFKTSSRGPLVSLIAVLVIIALNFSYWNKRKIIFACVIIIITLISLQLFLPTFFERIIFTFQNGDARLFHWKTAIDQFLNSPFLGDSLEENVNKIYPHNVWIESFMTTGVLGGIIFSYIIFIFIKSSIQMLLNNNYEYWIVLLFIQYFIATLFSGSLITNYLFWYLGAYLMNSYRKNKILYGY